MLSLKKIYFDTNEDFFCYINKSSPIVLEQGFFATQRIQVDKIVAELVLVDFLEDNEIALSNIAFNELGYKEGTKIKVSHIPQIKSYVGVKKKILGLEINKKEMFDIVSDITKGYYTKAQIAAFCASCDLSFDEIAHMTDAMVNVGTKLEWGYDMVVDKHCIGGVPGNRTTNIAIPIIASYGLYSPKSSSRAITSPSGTADTMEVLCKVDLSPEEVEKVVKKNNACIVWGGSVGLSPADHILIELRKEISVDSEGLMVASVLSKKIAAGSTHVLVVIPVGSSVKAKTMDDYNRLKELFEKVGERLNIKVQCIYENGTQPIGNGIGPALEAKDILKVLKNHPDAPQDLKRIALELTAPILEFDHKNVKKGEGLKLAQELLESGKAYKKFMDIVESQGRHDGIPSAKIQHDVIADKNGEVISFENKKLAKMCQIVGCPTVKEAGLYLHKHIGNKVRKGDKLFTIHTNSQGELKQALEYLNSESIMEVQ
ncbi:MAG: thymidine phosphorylase family protein [Rickettsiales bacterium]|jgi:thymidine phosphorylase|nr:thymidine phosphorylase family protein [Rickettsiales bacterium]